MKVSRFIHGYRLRLTDAEFEALRQILKVAKDRGWVSLANGVLGSRTRRVANAGKRWAREGVLLVDQDNRAALKRAALARPDHLRAKKGIEA